MKRTIFLLSLVFLFIANLTVFAQFKDYKLKVGLQGHYLIPANEYTEEEFNPSLLFRPNITFQLSRFFDLGFGIGYGWQQGEDYTKDKYKTTFIPLDVRIIFSPVNSDVVNPYLYLGAGATYWKLSDPPANPTVKPIADESGLNGLGELGLGIEFALNPSWLLDLTAGFNTFSDDKINGEVTRLQNKTLHDYDRYLNVGLGVSYVVESCHTDKDNDELEKCDEVLLGSDPLNPDTDGDGLKDGPEVNKYKTNLLKADTDGDGLKDGEEVNTYKTDPNKADTDGDGLKDGEEVNTYKTDPLNVDTDDDGLKDNEEVNTYKTDPVSADTDKDGLKDGEEVNKYKTEVLKADTDGDGLKDGEEVNKHKTDPLVVDTDKGTIGDGIEVGRGTDPLNPDDDIPIIKSKVGEAFVLEGITFKTASAEILPVSEEILTKAYNTLRVYPEVEVQIAGHTDHDGSNSYNQKLSERRAESVKNWLVNKGVAPKRITTIGYGELKPIDTNKTVAGKAKNRRIEFIRTK